MIHGFIFFSILPATDKKTNHKKETRKQAAVKIIFSTPSYCRELAPITPTVSMMAWGLSRETEEENTTCCFGERAALSCSFSGESSGLRQVTQPIYRRTSTPTMKRADRQSA